MGGETFQPFLTASRLSRQTDFVRSFFSVTDRRARKFIDRELAEPAGL
jgi:hypothetical protein